MPDKNAVRSMPVIELGLPKPTTARILELIALLCRKAGRDIPKNELQAVTVDQLISSGLLAHHLSQTAQDMLFNCLIKFGLTSIDWNQLPPRSVTLETARSIPKEAWLDLPACYLPVLSKSLLAQIMKHEDDPKTFTVRQLIHVADSGLEIELIMRGVMTSGGRTSYEKTRELLLELGFTPEEGPFFAFADRYRAIAELAAKHHIHYEKAREVLHIARLEGWIA